MFSYLSIDGIGEILNAQAYCITSQYCGIYLQKMGTLRKTCRRPPLQEVSIKEHRTKKRPVTQTEEHSRETGDKTCLEGWEVDSFPVPCSSSHSCSASCLDDEIDNETVYM